MLDINARYQSSVLTTTMTMLLLVAAAVKETKETKKQEINVRTIINLTASAEP